MTEYISKEVAIDQVLKQMRVSKGEDAMRERILNLEPADVVEGRMYRTVLEKMNEYADRLLKIRSIAGGGNG